MNKIDLKKLFDDMANLHIVVVGDVMLDNYWWGDTERMSPEAPVPVVSINRRESRLGGAANVALNCRALGAKVTLASVIGDDAEGVSLQRLSAEAGIDTSLLMSSNKRPTTTKVRIISRSQQMLRLDDEITDDLFTEEEHPFIDMVLRFLQREKPQLVILEDYNKGVLKENVIAHIVKHCNEIGIITVVDPKKKNFLSYKDVTIFKPNLKEVREGLHVDLDVINEQTLGDVHQKLNDKLHHSITFITLAEKGVFYNSGSSKEVIPSHVRNIADVSGAGDTVVATAGLVYTLTKDVRLMAEIANLAGGLVCEEVGVVPIDKVKLLNESQRVLANN